MAKEKCQNYEMCRGTGEPIRVTADGTKICLCPSCQASETEIRANNLKKAWGATYTLSKDVVLATHGDRN